MSGDIFFAFSLYQHPSTIGTHYEVLNLLHLFTNGIVRIKKDCGLLTSLKGIFHYLLPSLLIMA